MVHATKEMILRDVESLPENYKTKDVDALIDRYVREKYDLSALREHVLTEQRLHRIYFHGSLRQIRGAKAHMEFIDANLLFSDWWHTDQIIKFVSALDFDTALIYSKRYIEDGDPFVRRWGYVMWISKLCRDEARLGDILSLMKNDGEYYVQMAQAWLICELAVFFPKQVWQWMDSGNGLRYEINGRAIQKISDSYRVSDGFKARFKELRNTLREEK